MKTYRRNHVIAMLLSLVMVFAMMPALGQVYADDPDPYDLQNATVTFDEIYHVNDEDDATPYEDWYYVVDIGMELVPEVKMGDLVLDSGSYKALYSKCAYDKAKHEWSIIDETSWTDHFPTDAGVYFCKVEGVGAYHGAYEWLDLIRVEKFINSLIVSGKTATVKYSKLKKNNQTLAASKVFKFTNKGEGKLKFALVSAKIGAKSYKNYFKVNSSTGKVTVKKGLKKGTTYTVKVNVTAAGDDTHNAYTKTVAFNIKVK